MVPLSVTGETILGRADLAKHGMLDEESRIQVSREHARFSCTAEGVEVSALGQSPLGLCEASGDWEWLKKSDAPR